MPCSTSRAASPGFPGIGNDLRDIERAPRKATTAARLAIQVFAHRARKYVGAYAAVMGGVDAIVLTGGIGENAAAMRLRILQRLDYLGLVLDEDRNSDARVDAANPVARISAEHEPRRGARRADQRGARHCPADRARGARARGGEGNHGRSRSRSARGTSICARRRSRRCSARGASRPAGATSRSPEQYACEEKVNLIGPRGRIDGVRLLGPLRGKDQVEISRTDEFKLGVDAPMRDSGKTEGSAPIILEGPAGDAAPARGPDLREAAHPHGAGGRRALRRRRTAMKSRCASAADRAT